MKKQKNAYSSCTKSLLRAARKFGVDITIFQNKKGLFIFSKNGIKLFVKQHIIDLNQYIPTKLAGNKFITKKILQSHDIPVPHGFIESNISKALDMLDANKIKFPLVVKPNDGSQGEAVTPDIRQRHWFVQAIKEVYKYNRRKKGKPNSFLIEQFIEGKDYRILVLDGKALTVIQREPAYVIGDGVSTINQLIDRYNSQSDVGKDKPHCPIKKDFEFERNLQINKYFESSILHKGEKAFLRKNANVSTGGRSFECTQLAHPRYLQLAVFIANIFQLRFCSVDLISKDISKYQDYSIIEINDSPGFDIHEAPFKGKPFPVAEYLIKSAFAIHE